MTYVASVLFGLIVLFGLYILIDGWRSESIHDMALTKWLERKGWIRRR